MVVEEGWRAASGVNILQVMQKIKRLFQLSGVLLSGPIQRSLTRSLARSL